MSRRCDLALFAPLPEGLVCQRSGFPSGVGTAIDGLYVRPFYGCVHQSQKPDGTLRSRTRLSSTYWYVAKNYNSSKRDVAVYIDRKGKEWRGQLPPDFNSTASLIEDLLAYQRAGKSTPAPENVVELNPPPQEKVPASPTKSKFTKPRKLHVRPGLKPDGTPATREYIYGLQKCKAVSLRDRAFYRSMALSRMAVCIGLGHWSLPTHFPMPETGTKDVTTISLSICDDEWDLLVRNGADATWPETHPAPAEPDPVMFCVLAALGVVKLATPGPVLLIKEAQAVMADMQRALSIAKLWNPWLLPLPPADLLFVYTHDLHKRLKDGVFYDGDAEICESIKILVEEIEASHTACRNCAELWDKLITLSGKVANKMAKKLTKEKYE